MLGFSSVGAVPVAAMASAGTPMVSCDLSGDYAIGKYVSCDLVGNYSISGSGVYVSADMVGAYSISRFARADLQGIYSIGVSTVTPAQSRTVKFGGRQRVVVFDETDPGYRDGKHYVTKGENDQLFYVLDVTSQLNDASTTATSAVGVAVTGVVELAVPVVQSPQIMIKVGGMDIAAGAKNSYTTRVVCANGEQFDVTLNFERDTEHKVLSKDPDNLLYYGADVSAMLTAGATTAATVDQIVSGVQVLVPSVVQGSTMVVKLGGLNTTGAVDNGCTFRVGCQNGERFDKTIYFTQQDG